MLRVFGTAASGPAFASTSLRLHRTLALDRAVSAASKTVRDWSCLLAYPAVSHSLSFLNKRGKDTSLWVVWPSHWTTPPFLHSFAHHHALRRGGDPSSLVFISPHRSCS
ncbi:hypothetical protein CGCTS75_v005295 [Colletotrichum tropicale]|nr:hypothetical protein CGCTS75_v005295 [Colletotrichum tropicale]